MNKKLVAAALAIIVVVIAGLLMSGVFTPPNNAVKKVNDQNRPVREFTMQSFTEVIDGKYYPQYSLKDIIVNKGDLVRIKITVTKGIHDFKIDEYAVYADTLLEQEIAVEFVADKAGEFVYYCTKPGHRQNGHWGTLRVMEK